MPYEQSEAKFDGQLDFSGGCRMVGDPQETEYRYASNIVIRNGQAMTRPGFRRAFRVLQAGFKKGFWFGDKGAGTGFWFPFEFVATVWLNIQGTCFYRFLGETNTKQLIVADGTCYTHDEGYVKTVTVTNTISPTCKIEFVVGDQYIMMLRDDGSAAEYWDGTSTGFVVVPAGTPGSIPSHPNTGAFINGRFYLVDDRDDIYVSDAYSPTNYDHVYQLFSVAAGDGDEITRIFPFHDDYCIVFKKKRVDYLMGTNAVVVEGTHLSDVITIANVTKQHGLVAPKAVVAYGEEIAFLSYKGITSIRRVEEGKLVGIDVPLSADIQPLIDRINWKAIDCACAGYHNNYLLFAVPMDDSTINNAVLVYDLLARGGAGAWLPLWESDLLHPVEFVEDNEKLFFIGTDGTLREMFSDDPWDSEDVFDDAPVWSSATQYWTGDIVRRDNYGVQALWTASADSKGSDPLETTGYWTLHTDPQHAYDISSEIRTRYYRSGSKTAGKRYGRCEVGVKHQNPKWSIDVESENYNTKETIITNREYDRTKYDVCDKADWVTTNANLDFGNPYRKDYPVFIGNNISNYETVGAYILSGFTFDPPVALACDGTYNFSSWQSLTDPGGSTKNYPIYVLSTDVNYRIRQYGWSGIYAGTLPVWRIENYNIYVHTWFTLFTTTLTSGLHYPVSTDVWIPENVKYHTGTVAYSDNFGFAYPNQGLYIDPEDGVEANIWTPHSARFMPRVVNNQSFGLRIRNTQGRLAVTSILNIAQQDRFAAKDR